MKLRFIPLAVLIAVLPAAISFARETKDIPFKFRYADPVIFSHDFHLEKYNNNCRICHNTIFDVKKPRHYTMAEMEKTRSCGACHTGVKAFSVASDKDCIRCHTGKVRNVVYKPKGAAEAAFAHGVHIAKMDGKCRSCHNGKVITGREKNVTMAAMEKGKTCGACHDGKKAFTVAGNCGNCHKGMTPRELIFKANVVTDAVFSHKFHLTSYNCKDCHTSVFPYKVGVKKFTMAEMEQGKGCGTCHNGKDAFSAAGDCDRCHKGFKPAIVQFKNEGGEVKFSHEFHLGMYKCADCHTARFPFKAGAQHVNMAGMEAGKSCGGCHNGKDAFTVKENCEKCHKM
ncbi:MAG TPA: cytochrome c3 family protein [Geobacteraceae bacterium]|nr:cytochrome c3 family protein [Geobacteraceae bacterium]